MMSGFVRWDDIMPIESYFNERDGNRLSTIARVALSQVARIPIQYDFMLECDDEYPQWASDTFWVEMEDGCTWQELWEEAKVLARDHYREYHRGNWYGYVSFVAGIPLGGLQINDNEIVSWDDPRLIVE